MAKNISIFDSCKTSWGGHFEPLLDLYAYFYGHSSHLSKINKNYVKIGKFFETWA